MMVKIPTPVLGVKPGQRFRDVRVEAEGATRVLEVNYIYYDAGRAEHRVRCRVAKDTRIDVDQRESTTVALRRLLSPVFYERDRRAS